MMIELTTRTGQITSTEKVICVLREFFGAYDAASSSPAYVSTRDIANKSELSIYKARHILIKLEKEGVITSVKQCKSLYWNKTPSFGSLPA